MRAYEIYGTGYYSAADDKLNVGEIGDTRKKTLRLRDINKLKKMRAREKLEGLKRQELLSVMYGITDEDDDERMKNEIMGIS